MNYILQEVRKSLEYRQFKIIEIRNASIIFTFPNDKPPMNIPLIFGQIKKENILYSDFFSLECTLPIDQEFRILLQSSNELLHIKCIDELTTPILQKEIMWRYDKDSMVQEGLPIPRLIFIWKEYIINMFNEQKFYQACHHITSTAIQISRKIELCKKLLIENREQIE